MRTIKLSDIEWNPDSSFFTPAQTKAYYGVPRKVKNITIHWYNSPDKAGTITQTINYLKRAEVSTHFVVSGKRIVQMVNMANTSFNSLQNNPATVSIECDPNNLDYETIGALCKFIRSYFGNIPIEPHNKYVATACPGTVNLQKIRDYANGKITTPTKPAPITKPKLWRVFKYGKQVGAYSNAQNAYNAYVIHKAERITNPDNKDVTFKLIVLYQREVETELPDPQVAVDELDVRVGKLESLVDGIIKFLSKIFKGV